MRKVLFTILVLSLIACAFAISASAATLYKDVDGNEMFRYEIYDGTEESYKSHLAGTIKSYEGSFPNTDASGNALTWYVVSTETIGDDTVHTVASFFTLDTTGEHATLSENGEYKYVNKAKELSVVSVFFPDNAGIATLNLSDNGYGDVYTFGKTGSHILFITLPNTLTAFPSRIGQATNVLEVNASDDALYTSIGQTCFHESRNLRSIDIPKNVSIIYASTHSNNGFAFFNCVNLEQVNFAEGSALETIQNNAFNGCRSLKEITVPNSVINLGARAFQDCSSLETIRLGANAGKGIENYNVQSMLYGCSSLKYVYISDTMVPAEGSHMFNSGANGMVFFYTGNYEQYEAFRAILVTLKDSGKFVNATAIEWDSANSDQYYKDLAAADNKNYVVYGYSRCDAFYGGHSWKGENQVIFESYFTEINVGDTCANCGENEVKTTIDALFISKGVSAKTFGTEMGLVQGYEINKTAIDTYKTYVSDFNFGVLAYANKNGTSVQPKPGDDKVIDIVFDNMANDYIEVKVTGIPSDFADSPIVFCIYAIEGDKFYYLDNGVTSESIIGNSYNELVNN